MVRNQSGPTSNGADVVSAHRFRTLGLKLLLSGGLIGLFILGNLLLSLDWYDTRVLQQMRETGRSGGNFSLRSFLWANPENYLQLAQMTDDAVEREKLLIKALDLDLISSGVHIYRLREALISQSPLSISGPLYDLALSMEPQNPYTILNMANYLVRSGMWAQAYLYYLDLLTFHPQRVKEILPTLWLLDPDLPRLKKAVPRTEQAIHALAQFLEGRKMFEEALVEYDDLTALVPDREDYQYQKARLLLDRLKRPADALSLSREQLISITDQKYLLLFLQVKLESYAAQGELIAAKKVAQDIEEKCKNDPNWLAKLSQFYQSINEPVMAAQYLEKALVWDTHNPTYMERLGDLYLRNNDWKKAIEEYKRAQALIKAGGSSPQVDRLEQKIRDLLLKAAEGHLK